MNSSQVPNKKTSFNVLCCRRQDGLSKVRINLFLITFSSRQKAAKVCQTQTEVLKLRESQVPRNVTRANSHLLPGMVSVKSPRALKKCNSTKSYLQERLSSKHRTQANSHLDAGMKSMSGRNELCEISTCWTFLNTLQSCTSVTQTCAPT